MDARAEFAAAITLYMSFTIVAIAVTLATISIIYIVLAHTVRLAKTLLSQFPRNSS